MDIDADSVEIGFAQKLACGEPKVRKRAFEQLKSWMTVQSKADGGFNAASLMRLCKGLHYVFWMQDKPLLQEELAEKIAGLLNCFGNDHVQTALFLRTLIIALSQQWPFIDRWRMDKFLMLMRRILRATFARMRDLKWCTEEANEYFNTLKETVITSEPSVCDAIKFHFASMFLDELDGAGNVPKEAVTFYLSVYADVLAEKNSGYLFESFTDEIFTAILQEKSEKVALRGEAGSDAEPSEPEAGIQIDYARFSEIFFDLGKSPAVNAKRRERLYKLSDQFKLAASDIDPFHRQPKEKPHEAAAPKRQQRKKKKRSVGVAKKIQKKPKRGKGVKK